MEFLDSLISLHLLDGIECYHSLHDREKTKDLLNYCRTHGLYASGGSDYHGDLKPSVFIGESIEGVQIPFKILEPWLKSLSKYHFFQSACITAKARAVSSSQDRLT